MKSVLKKLNPLAAYQQKRIYRQLYSREVFLALVEHERRRADRTGEGFSVVSFDVRRAGSDGHVFRRLYDTLRERVRSTDAVGWFDEGWLGVLLVDTPARNAGFFIRDVFERLGDAGRTLACRTYAYPSELLQYEDGRYQDIQPLPDFISREKRQSEGTPSKQRAVQRGTESTAPLPPLPLEPHMGAGIPLWKRGFDILCAVVGLILLLPLFIVVALWIKTVSPGPVFYKQTRVGFLGRPFKLWKFRTMKVGTDTSVHREYVSRLIRDEDQVMKKLDDRDPNIIPMGRFLRLSGIDELPQLINVLLGHMSLVGPRPCLPYEFREYLHWHKRRFYALPGITGLWQVEGKDHVTFREMVRADILYEQHRSLWMDVRIILKTFPAVWRLVMRTT